jgi:hypothetical protein
MSWLESRGMSSKGAATELRETVMSYYESGEIPPIISNNICTSEQFLKMVYLMHKMIVSCMTLQNDYEIEYLEALIRCFLSHYDQFIVSISTNDIPGWVTSYNFMSLLNIPDILREYGSMKPLWEGGEDGESYLKFVKKELKCGLIRQWPVWLLTSLLEEQKFNQLVDVDLNLRQDNLVDWKIYGSITRINNLLKKHKVL